MNDDKKMSSSNTTPFNNIGNHNRVLNNDKLTKYTGNRQIRPRNTNLNNERIDGGINNIPPIQDKKDSPNNNQQPVKDNNSNISKDNNQIKSRRNPFGPKNRLNNTASNLRDKLDTNPNMKDEVAKKGAEKLKKSANPYAKAAGYAASFLQNRKDKKKKEKEDTEKDENENKNEENNDNNEDSSTSLVENKTRTRLIVHLAFLIVPYVLIFILIFSAIMPVLNAYSWFQSIFHHKSDDAESYYVHDKNQAEQLEREIKFNDAIVGSSDGTKKGIIEEYKEKYNVTLDKSLLVSLLLYRNVTRVQDDYDDITEEEINDNLETSSEELNEEKYNELKKYFEKELGRGLFVSEDGALLLNVKLINNHGADKNLLIGAFNLARKNSIDGFNEIYFNNTVDFWILKGYKTYQDAYIDFAADSMLCRNDGSVTTDIKVDGCVYNNLITNGTDANNFIKVYYSDILKDTEPDTIKRLVDEIFDYAEGGRLMDDDDQDAVNGGVIGDTSIIHLQTCDQPYAVKKINDLNVFDNPPWNQGTNYPDYLNVKDYIKGVVSREIGVSSDYKEAMKAQAIIALSYLIHDFRSGFNLKSGEMYFPSGTCRQATCSPIYGCTSVAVKGTNLHTNYIGENRFSGGNSHDPISEEEDAILEEILSDVFGKIMVNKGVTSATYSGSGDTIHTSYYNTIKNKNCDSGKCFGQIEAQNDARNGMTYEQILNKYYSSVDFDIINITEGIYTSVGFSNANFNGNIVYYNQNDYSNVQFCGRSGSSISSSGCGVTSAAIVASSLTGNRTYDPVYMMNWAYREKECGAGISGTNAGFFAKFAQGLGFNYQSVGRENTNAVVEALKTGKALVIAHMGKGHFTGGGHYIVLSGINDNGEVMVQDPNSRERSHFWSINLIANELQTYGEFHIISL